MSENKKTISNMKAGISCGVILMELTRLCICWPIWYYLMYFMLDSLDTQTSHWVAYWVYVPLSFILSIMVAVFTHVVKDMK